VIPRIAGIMRGSRKEVDVTRQRQAVHVYTFEPGPPPYIATEILVPGRVVAELMEDQSPWTAWHMVQETSTSKALTREQLLATPTGRVALAAWDGRDTRYSDRAYEAHRRRDLENAARRHAAEGCPTAAELVKRGATLDELDEYENSHSCKHDHPRLKVVR
jgi:hypothetical protein